MTQVTFLTRLLWAWQTPSFLDSTSASPAHKVRARDPLGIDSFPHARHSLIYLLMQAFVTLPLIAYYVRVFVTDGRHNGEQKQTQSLPTQAV